MLLSGDDTARFTNLVWRCVVFVVASSKTRGPTQSHAKSFACGGRSEAILTTSRRTGGLQEVPELFLGDCGFVGMYVSMLCLPGFPGSAGGTHQLPANR